MITLNRYGKGKIMEITALELLKIAQNIEENGYQFYTRLTSQVKSEASKQRFAQLAQDEKQHKFDFENIISEQANLAQEKEEYLDSDDLNAYLTTMLNAEIFKKLEKWEKTFKIIKTEREALELGIEAEKISIDYYQKLKSYFSEEKVKNILEKIKKEEDKHLKILTELLKSN